MMMMTRGGDDPFRGGENNNNYDRLESSAQTRSEKSSSPKRRKNNNMDDSYRGAPHSGDKDKDRDVSLGGGGSPTSSQSAQSQSQSQSPELQRFFIFRACGQIWRFHRTALAGFVVYVVPSLCAMCVCFVFFLVVFGLVFVKVRRDLLPPRLQSFPVQLSYDPFGIVDIKRDATIIGEGGSSSRGGGGDVQILYQLRSPHPAFVRARRAVFATHAPSPSSSSSSDDNLLELSKTDLLWQAAKRPSSSSLAAVFDEIVGDPEDNVVFTSSHFLSNQLLGFANFDNLTSVYETYQPPASSTSADAELLTAQPLSASRLLAQVVLTIPQTFIRVIRQTLQPLLFWPATQFYRFIIAPFSPPKWQQSGLGDSLLAKNFPLRICLQFDYEPPRPSSVLVARARAKERHATETETATANSAHHHPASSSSSSASFPPEMFQLGSLLRENERVICRWQAGVSECRRESIGGPFGGDQSIPPGSVREALVAQAANDPIMVSVSLYGERIPDKVEKFVETERAFFPAQKQSLATEYVKASLLVLPGALASLLSLGGPSTTLKSQPPLQRHRIVLFQNVLIAEPFQLVGTATANGGGQRTKNVRLSDIQFAKVRFWKNADDRDNDHHFHNVQNCKINVEIELSRSLQLLADHSILSFLVITVPPALGLSSLAGAAVLVWIVTTTVRQSGDKRKRERKSRNRNNRPAAGGRSCQTVYSQTATPTLS